VKKEARIKAATIFSEANGKISNAEIARQVGVNALTVGKWKEKDGWAAGAEKIKTPAAPRKRAALEKAQAIYVESGGKTTNTTLAEKVGVSAATIANWKKAGAWLEMLPSPLRAKAEATETQPTAEPVTSREEVSEPKGEAAPVEMVVGHEEHEEQEEIEVDLEAIACPGHFAVLNKRIDEMLGRGYLSPLELKIAAEAKEAALRAAAAYLEVLERASRH
jgi:uncharacterized protein YjcR